MKENSNELGKMIEELEKGRKFAEEIKEEVGTALHPLTKYGITNLGFKILSSGGISFPMQMLTDNFWNFYSVINQIEDERLKEAIKSFDRLLDYGEKVLGVDLEFSMYLVNTNKVLLYENNIEEIVESTKLSRLVTKIKHSTKSEKVIEKATEIDMKLLFDPENVAEDVFDLLGMELKEQKYLMEPLIAFLEERIQEAMTNAVQKRDQLKRKYGIY